MNKHKLTLYVDKYLVEDAKKHNIHLSATLEKMLLKYPDDVVFKKDRA